MTAAELLLLLIKIGLSIGENDPPVLVEVNQKSSLSACGIRATSRHS